MNTIFSYFLKREKDLPDVVNKREAFCEWFATSFPYTEFKSEDLIMYQLVSYAVRLSVPIKERYLNVFLDIELKPIMVKFKIHVPGTEQLSFEDVAQTETALQVTREVITKGYYSLINQEADVDDFVADADAWMTNQLNDRLIDMYSEGFEIISNLKGKRVGVQDALEYTSDVVATLQEVYDKEKLEELDSNYGNDDAVFKFVLDTGIAPIDEDTKGFFTCQLIGIEAAPGLGKTRFVNGVCAYRAAVIYKKNVLIHALEQSAKEIRSILISRHIWYLYKKQISDGLILKNIVPPELQEIVDIAEDDLFNSGKYGKIVIIDDSMYLETFIKKISLEDKLKGPFDVIIIDYMTLIEQKGGEYAKSLLDYQITSKAYKRFKRYVLHNRKLGIGVNQLNRSGTDASDNDKVTTTTDAAGGMEVYRSTDYNIVITATEAMKAQQKRRLSTPKQRGSAGYGSCIVDVRLAVAYWYINEANVTL